MMELFHRSMNQVRESSMPTGQDRKKQGPAGVSRHEQPGTCPLDALAPGTGLCRPRVKGAWCAGTRDHSRRRARRLGGSHAMRVPGAEGQGVWDAPAPALSSALPLTVGISEGGSSFPEADVTGHTVALAALGAG